MGPGQQDAQETCREEPAPQSHDFMFIFHIATRNPPFGSLLAKAHRKKKGRRRAEATSRKHPQLEVQTLAFNPSPSALLRSGNYDPDDRALRHPANQKAGV